jgi:hypothetical protein
MHALVHSALRRSIAAGAAVVAFAVPVDAYADDGAPTSGSTGVVGAVAEVAEPVSAAAQPVVAPVTSEPEAEQATAPQPAPPTAPEPAPAPEGETAPVEKEPPTVAAGGDTLAPVSRALQPVVRAVEGKAREVGGAASRSVGDAAKPVAATVSTAERATAAAVGAIATGVVRTVERTTKAATAVVTDAGHAVAAAAGQAVATETRTPDRAVGGVEKSLELTAVTDPSQVRQGRVVLPSALAPPLGPVGSNALETWLMDVSGPTPPILSTPASADAKLEPGGQGA